MNLRKQKRELAMAFAHEVFQGRTRSGLTQHAVADQAFISLRWYQKIEKGEVLPGFLAGVCLMRPFRFEPRPFQRRRSPMFLYPPGGKPLFSPPPGQSAFSALRLLKPAAGQAAFPPTSPQMRRLRGGWQGAAPTPNSAPFI